MLTGILAGLAAGALWGLVFVAPYMAGTFASVDLTAGRFVAYGAVAVGMLLWGLKGKPRRPTLAQAWAALWLSVLGFTGYYLLLVWAIRDAGAEMPALIIGTIPVWVMLLGKPQGLRWAALVPGLVLTVAGLALMAEVPHGDTAVSGAGSYWRGIAIALVALVFRTAFAILNSAWLKRHPEVRATDWANWLGVATGLGGCCCGWQGAPACPPWQRSQGSGSSWPCAWRSVLAPAGWPPFCGTSPASACPPACAGSSS